MKGEKTMSKKMYVADRQTGTFIDEIATIDEGLELIRQYEKADKAEGTYEEDFYEIVDENHCAVTVQKETTMKEISLDNGHTFLTAEEAMPEIEEKGLWDVVAEYMEDDAREEANREIAPCTELEFLKKYLEAATEDLVIG
jgi:hypothetical protein